LPLGARRPRGIEIANQCNDFARVTAGTEYRELVHRKLP
jgi:hypothetical protein